MKSLGLALALAFLAGACAPRDHAPKSSADSPASPGVVEVVTRDRSFEAPATIRSGWTTFRFRNESPMTHFALVERMPEGHGIADQQAEAAPVFQDGMNLLSAGEVEAAVKRFGDLPAWFGDIVFLGGPGLTGPGVTSQATVYLEPGTYLLECYVKTGGVFHSFNPDTSSYGMVHEFTVTEAASPATEPGATLHLAISSGGGIEMGGMPVAGAHTVAVRFTDQKVHANFVGHDVHLVRVSGETDLGGLESWMDWTRPGGLETPAPVQFLGGLNEMPAGSTGYFTVTLEPGDYVWVAEVPGASKKGMLRPFTVAPAEGEAASGG